MWLNIGFDNQSNNPPISISSSSAGGGGGGAYFLGFSSFLSLATGFSATG